MLILIGRGGEGKSRIGCVLRSIFGDSMNTCSLQKIETNRFSRADLEFKLLSLDDDMQMEALPKTNVIKTLVTNEGKIDIERKCIQSVQRQLYARLMCFSNGALTAKYDNSYAFYRRQIIIHVRDKNEDRIDDPYLAEKLIGEREGIFMWMLEGLKRLIENDYRFTASERGNKQLEAAAKQATSVQCFMKSDYVSYGSNKRIDTLGQKYSTESLEKIFVENRQGIINVPAYLTRNRMTFEPRTIVHLQIELMHRKKYKESVVDIYYDLFIELLKVIKTAVDVLWQPLSPELRAEARSIEEYVAERRFITEHNLLTESAVGDFVSATNARISELESERTAFDNRARRASPEEREQLHTERRAVTERLKPLRQSLKTAESISDHIPKIEKLLETELQMERDVLNGKTKTNNKSRNTR